MSKKMDKIESDKLLRYLYQMRLTAIHFPDKALEELWNLCNTENTDSLVEAFRKGFEYGFEVIRDAVLDSDNEESLLR